LYGIDLVGPVGKISSWQARQEGGLTAEQFQLDWENRQALCPEGKPARTWSESQEEGGPVVQVRFAPADCEACSRRSHCTRSPQGRILKLRPHSALLREARQQQHTAAFQQEYAPRAGIEGTIAEAVRAHGARVSRYLGQSKTWLQETLLAAAINLERAARWLMGDRPETTRISRFMALAPTQAMVG
jgi:transposase